MFLAWAGLLIAALILSLKTGLILGMSGIKGKQVSFYSLVFGLSLGLLVMLFLPFQNLLVGVLDKYTFLGSVSIAILLIYLGLEGNGDSRDQNEEGLSKKYMAAFLPCPLCLIALALTVIILGPGLEISPVTLGWVMSGIFFLMLITVAFGFRKLMQNARVCPENVLNGFLLFIGIFTLCCGLFIPSLVQAMSQPFSPFVLDSGVWSWGAMIGMVVVCIAGFIKFSVFNRKGEIE